MSDVLFRYLLTARRRDRSVFRRLVFADEPLLEAGVEQLVETAAARIEVTSQHERVTRRQDTVPASRRHRVRFYDVAQPNRPRPGRFEQRFEEFPLRSTLQVYTCDECSGLGEVRCRSCSGRGIVGCLRCGGSGRVRNGGDSRTCGGCGGSGDNTCHRCRGSGEVTCDKCHGEGELASWDVEVYRWLVENRSAEEYPLPTEQSRVRRAFLRWLEVNRDLVASLGPTAVAEHLGYETPETLELAARADVRRRGLEDEAHKSADRYLFHRTDRSLAPVGYTVVRLAGKGRFYWLVGRGEKALEVTPRGRPDGWKCAGWLGLGSGGVLGYEGIVQTYDLALPLLESLALFGDLAPAGLAGGSVLGWLFGLAGVRRVRRRPPPVATLGLIVTTGQPTAFLTCLAYLGSYLGRLQVSDRAYDVQSQRLLGRMRPDRQSESLSIEVPDGRKIRLVEVARPHRLSDPQLRLMVQALDGVMILEYPERPAAELAARISGAAAEPPRIGSLLVTGDGDPRAPDAALPLEAVRRAFVEDIRGDLDWQTLFDRMWQPLGELIAPADGAEEAL